MKKIYSFFTIFLIVSVFVISQEITIYDKISQIKENPNQFTFVIAQNAGQEEVKLASELIKFLGMTKSNFDTRISRNKNLVIFGLANTNKKIAENIDSEINGALVKATNDNLIITASSINSLRSAANTVKNYEDNKRSLSEKETSPMNLLAPIQDLFSNIIAVYVGAAVLLLLTAVLLIRGKRKQKIPVRQKPTQTYPGLRNYISANLRKGYSEDQVKNALIKSGWKINTLDPIFKEFRWFYRK